jgi:GH24 family phage-related lysozyme (muramidase)
MLVRLIKEEIINFSDDHYIDLLLNPPLNEGISWSDVKRYISKVADKTKLVQKAIEKFNKTTSRTMKKYLLLIALSVLTSTSISKSSAAANSFDGFDVDAHKAKLEQIAAEKAKQDSINWAEVMQVMAQWKIDRIDHFTVSPEGKEFIKSHEGYRDQAYDIGDGMITIGWGHAERVRNSPYKVGDQIDQATAEALFNEDIAQAEAGVKRILKKELKAGSITEINQSMFDALVSMAFNMGTYGLSTTEFFQDLMAGTPPMKAAQKILDARVGSFSGLKKRRKKEYNWFVKDLMNV